MSNLFSVNSKQIAVSAFGGLIAAFVTAVYPLITNGTIDITTVNWGSVFTSFLKAFVAFIVAHFFTSAQGNPLGMGDTEQA